MSSSFTGQVIDGRYEVLGILGEGGMGVVLRARHKFTGQDVAIKILRAEIALNNEARARFLAEARAPAAIGHPAIVSITDAGTSNDGLYFAMELLRGEPLAAALTRGTAAFPWTRHVTRQLLDALVAAHAAGFIHRDLKPANVFLAGDPVTPIVKLLDFGIAKVMSQAIGEKGRTATGSVMGTLAYMSPEQLTDSSQVDARTDLWAVGVMMFEMLSGALPYEARSFADMLVAMHRGQPRTIRSLLPNVSPEIEAFLARALAVDPRGRFASAAEMRDALASIPEGQVSFSSAAPPMPQATEFAPPGTTNPSFVAPAGTAPSGVSHLAPPSPPRSWLLPVVAGAILLAGAAGGALAFFLSQKKPEPASTSAADAKDDDRHAPPADTQTAKPHGKAHACQEACVALAESCGLHVAADCVVACEASPARSCVADALKAKDRCDELAFCAWEGTCKTALDTGTKSCQEAASCQALHLGDTTASCACIEGVSPAAALLLWKNDACALAACGPVCSGAATPMRCSACVAQSCRRENAECLAH